MKNLQISLYSVILVTFFIPGIIGAVFAAIIILSFDRIKSLKNEKLSPGEPQK